MPSNASRRGTVAACERSLKRLKVDTLDCYLLHWRGSHPLEDTVAAFDELIAAGKIRSWGVSNFDTDDLNELLAVAGKGRIACNQVLYHLLERAIEHAVIPWCEKHGVAVVAYSPFGHNEFPTPRSKAGDVLQGIADAHGASPRQVALAFLTRRVRCWRFRRRRRRNMRLTTRRPEHGRLIRAKFLRWTPRFRVGQNRADCRCCSEHGS